MKIYSNKANAGRIFDTAAKDTLVGGLREDIFFLSNDGITDKVRKVAWGEDRIDLTAWDAGWDQLMIKQVSLTSYVVSYREEEKLRVFFQTPAPEDIPESGMLLDADSFIFRPGLPGNSLEVRFEQSSTQNEVIKGTTSPDEFIFARDEYRDTIKKFEPGKDVVDLADYNINFFDMKIAENKYGRVVLTIPSHQEDGIADKLVLIDISEQLRAEDVVPEWFIF